MTTHFGKEEFSSFPEHCADFAARRSVRAVLFFVDMPVNLAYSHT